MKQIVEPNKTSSLARALGVDESTVQDNWKWINNFIKARAGEGWQGGGGFGLEGGSCYGDSCGAGSPPNEDRDKAEYWRDGQFEWCGSFPAYCYGVAGLRRSFRKGFASTLKIEGSAGTAQPGRRWFDRWVSAYPDEATRPPFPENWHMDGRFAGQTNQEDELRPTIGPQDLAPGDIVIVGKGASTDHNRGDNQYGNHITICERVTPEGMYTYEGNSRGWIYGTPETKEFTRNSDDPRGITGVMRSFRPFFTPGLSLSTYRILWRWRALPMDWDPALAPAAVTSFVPSMTAGYAPAGAMPSPGSGVLSPGPPLSTEPIVGEQLVYPAANDEGYEIVFA